MFSTESFSLHPEGLEFVKRTTAETNVASEPDVNKRVKFQLCFLFRN